MAPTAVDMVASPASSRWKNAVHSKEREYEAKGGKKKEKYNKEAKGGSGEEK